MRFYIHRCACDPSHLRHIGTCTLPPCPALAFRVTTGALLETRGDPPTPLTPSAPGPPGETCPPTRDRDTCLVKPPFPPSRARFWLLEPKQEGGEPPLQSCPHLPPHFHFCLQALLIRVSGGQEGVSCLVIQPNDPPMLRRAWLASGNPRASFLPGFKSPRGFSACVWRGKRECVWAGRGRMQGRQAVQAAQALAQVAPNPASQ